ncbi:hypothetical protein BKA61DRAFT_711359 [Leptodontidium sp. MPI-SDFR-AT-0119]|nr:hypothetical protein BKA61DRAFT_711359 [Leptodontidium sp. MPI-SDFR-AT-0119]
MNIKSALLALTAISALASLASTSPLVERDINPQYSVYAKCIQEAVPAFPFGDVKPTAEKVGECFARIQTGGRGKRSAAAEPDLQTSPAPVVAVGTSNTDLTIRGNDDDDVLNIDASPWCDSDKVNDNFIWVTEIRDKAVDFCTILVTEINEKGLSKDGGVGQFVNLFTNGHDKQGHQLKDGVKVVATFVLKVYTPAGMAFETVKEVAKGVQGACVQGLKVLATKETGCTDDLDYYRPSKAKGYTGTGAIGGLLHILWKGVPFAALKLDLANA